MFGIPIVCASLVLPLLQEAAPPAPADAQDSQPAMEVLAYSTMLERLHDYRWMVLMPRHGEGVLARDLVAQPGRTMRLEIAGPAAFTRLWFSSPSGVVHFYVDGAEEPSLSWDLAQCASGNGPAYLTPPLALALGNSWESHLPLPFAESMVMEYTPSGTAGVRVQLDIRNFGEALQFASVSESLLAENQAAIERVAEILTTGERPTTMVKPDPFKAGSARYFEMTPEMTNNMGEYTWALLGRGMVRWIELRFIHQVAPAEVEEMLRSLEMRVELHVDNLAGSGEEIFRVPLGDFFGSAPGAHPLNSYPMGLDGRTGTFHFRLPIPFEDGMRIVLSSDLEEYARFTMSIGLDIFGAEGVMPPMRLHSGFVRAREQGASEATTLQIEGPAHLAAYSLSTTSSALQPMAQHGPFAYVDYLGGPMLAGFSHLPLRTGPMGFGDTSMLRVFGLEAPSSLHGINFSPQVTFPEGDPTEVSATAWFYAPEGTKHSMDRVYPVEQRQPAAKPKAEFLIAKDALEAEAAQGLRMSEGTSIQVHSVLDPTQRWSQLQFLEWSTNEAQTMVAFPFALGVSGKYRLFAQFAKGEQYGTFEVLLDGKKVGEVLDGAAEALVPTGELNLGEHRMMARNDHTLSLRTLDGKHIGIDYFRFEKVEVEQKGQ